MTRWKCTCKVFDVGMSGCSGGGSSGCGLMTGWAVVPVLLLADCNKMSWSVKLHHFSIIRNPANSVIKGKGIPFESVLFNRISLQVWKHCQTVYLTSCSQRHKGVVKVSPVDGKRAGKQLNSTSSTSDSIPNIFFQFCHLWWQQILMENGISLRDSFWVWNYLDVMEVVRRRKDYVALPPQLKLSGNRGTILK